MNPKVLFRGERHLPPFWFLERLQNGLLDGHDIDGRLLTHLNIIVWHSTQTILSKARHIISGVSHRILLPEVLSEFLQVAGRKV